MGTVQSVVNACGDCSVWCEQLEGDREIGQGFDSDDADKEEDCTFRWYRRSYWRHGMTPWHGMLLVWWRFWTCIYSVDSFCVNRSVCTVLLNDFWAVKLLSYSPLMRPCNVMLSLITKARTCLHVTFLVAQEQFLPPSWRHQWLIWVSFDQTPFLTPPVTHMGDSENRTLVHWVYSSTLTMSHGCSVIYSFCI